MMNHRSVCEWYVIDDLHSKLSDDVTDHRLDEFTVRGRLLGGEGVI